MIRPRGVDASDAQNDAALILLEMRRRWKDHLAEHLPPERQERMVVAWARLRLIDKYETEFARQKMTRPLSAAGGVGAPGDPRQSAARPRLNEARVAYTRTFAGHTGPDEVDDRDVPDKRPRTLSDLERSEIREMVGRLPEKQAATIRMLLFDGLTQQEVAAALKCSQPAVSSLYMKARENLREMLAAYEDNT